MEKISVSSRFNVFPAGLRVLVVDDDLTWLKILEKMLIKCHYEVTTSCLATEALNILRERKNKFDIVISDVNMPDMDGFTLLELVGLEMDLPVIMMSVDGETSRVMKGVQHGACDYLLKPVRMKELRIIWQHVFRKKMNEIKEIEINEDAHKIRNYLNEFDSSYLATGSDLSSRKKRKDIENQEHDDYEFMDSSSSKKSRVVWSVDLHQKFVQAVNQSGSEKVGPKKILDLMNVPWLTRENVASHLQKYRMCLDRLKKQNEPKNSFCVPKQPDLKNPPSGFGYQSPISVNGDNSTTCSFANKIVMEDMSPKVLEDLCIGPFSARTELSAGDIAHPRKASNSSRMSLTDSFESLGQDINYTSFRANFLEQISWCSTEIPTLQFSELLEEEQEQYLYTNQPLPVHKSAPFMISATSNEETVSGVPPKLRPPFEHFGSICPTECKDNSVSSDISTQASGDMCTRLSSIKTNSFHQNLFGPLESYQQNFMKRSDSTSASSEEDQQLWSLQDYDYFGPVELNNIGILNDPENITELSSHLYDKNVR